MIKIPALEMAGFLVHSIPLCVCTSQAVDRSIKMGCCQPLSNRQIMSESNHSRVVYTTGIGRVCPECGKSFDACVCRKQAAQRPAGDGIVRIRRETKGRNGKGVTVIAGVPLDESGLLALGKQLKARCGTGGTVKDGNIEIQGDHRDLLFSELTKLGWTVKKAGG